MQDVFTALACLGLGIMWFLVGLMAVIAYGPM